MSSSEHDIRALRRLARHHGVQHSYTAVDGRRRTASAEVLVAVLRSLGVPVSGTAGAAEAWQAAQADSARQVIEPVLVHRAGPRPRGPADITLPDDADPWIEIAFGTGGTMRRPLSELRTGTVGRETSDGRVVVRHRIDLDRLGPIEPGYHRVAVDLGSTRPEATLIAAPARCPIATATWGVLAPLYSVRGSGDCGTGTFGDLAQLADWVSGLGGGIVGTLPLYAAFLDGPNLDPSPYRPASRLAWNEVFVDLHALSDLAASPAARDALGSPEVRRQCERLRASDQASLPEVLAAKRRVLQPLADDFFAAGPGSPRRATFAAWVDQHPEIVAYAQFRARLEQSGGSAAPPWSAPGSPWSTPGSPWSTADTLWPATGSPPPAGPFAYHLYAQFVADEQLGAVSGRTGLQLDLPVGVHPDGFDPQWAPGTFVTGVSCGAPPDDFFTEGQSWGLPPLHPEGARVGGHAYLAAVLRRAMAHASVLRLDHVMGLHRMWFVPDGASARDGAYVSYRSEELRAVAVLESSRAGTALVGEDLGTVPVAVRRDMRTDGMLRTAVWQFEATPVDPLPAPPAESVASIGTHDTPPFASVIDPRPEDALAGYTAEQPPPNDGLRSGGARWAADLPAGAAPRTAAPRTAAANTAAPHTAAAHAAAAAYAAAPHTAAANAATTAHATAANAAAAAHAAAPHTAAANAATTAHAATVGATGTLGTTDLDRRAAWQAALGPTVPGALRQVLLHLAGSAARIVMVEIGDLWLERMPQNRPGEGWTGAFRLRARRSLDDLRQDPEVTSVLASVDRARRGATGQTSPTRPDPSTTGQTSPTRPDPSTTRQTNPTRPDPNTAGRTSPTRPDPSTTGREGPT